MWKNEFSQLSHYHLEAFVGDITRAGRRTRVRRRRRRVIGSLETRVSRPSPDPAMNRWRREGLSFNRSTLPFPPLHHPPGRHGTRIRRECILTPRSYFHWDPGTFPIEEWSIQRYDGLPVYTIPRHLSFRCRTKLDDRQGVGVGWLRDGWCMFLFFFFSFWINKGEDDSSGIRTRIKSYSLFFFFYYRLNCSMLFFQLYFSFSNDI